MTKYDNTTTANDDGSLRAVRLDELKKGTFFMRIPEGRIVWVKDIYDHTEKKFYCEKHNTYGYMYLKGSTIVYIGFTY